MKNQVVMDIECYRDYFLVKFMRMSDGLMLDYELYEEEGGVLDTLSIQSVLEAYEVVTFNGNNYDLPILAAALYGANNIQLKEFTDEIILTDVKHWQFYKKHMIPQLRVDHIDLIEVAPGIASLKIYGGRLHADKMQDLPIEPHESIAPNQRELLRHYCGNDLKTTALLLKELTPQIDLRRVMSATYGLDLRSKSDAQIAEAVIVAEVGKRTGSKIHRPSVKTFGDFNYEAPSFIDFTTPQLENALTIATSLPFVMKLTGKIDMPKELEKLKIHIGKSTYQMGMGGLHSTEKECFHVSDSENSLWNYDVASYYPSIILNCGLFPTQIGPVFLDVYRNIVNERLTAKHCGNKVKADSLKITINGSFGKLGSPYSALYAPNLLVQVTVTGQLALLMLIEKLEAWNIPVVSANTDGVVIKCASNKVESLKLIIKWWENKTGFVMEGEAWDALYSRDVNNYLALKGNSIKTKGCFSNAGIQKNAQNEICNEAVSAFLKNGTSLKDTILGCNDVTKFVTIRTVKGGAIKDDKFLGKAIRWYYAKGEDGEINYKTNGNKVPRSDGARPLMDLPDVFPADLNHEWYLNECNEMLMSVGVINRIPKVKKTRSKKEVEE